MKIVTAYLLLFAACQAWAGADDPQRGEIWQLPGRPGYLRWLIVHDIEATPDGPLCHVEVLERKSRAQPWDLRRLAPHMAITLPALRADLVRPLRTGAVYPEAYDDAYLQWRIDREAGHASICNTSVTDCLR